MICEMPFKEGDEIVFNRKAIVTTCTRLQWDRAQKRMVDVEYLGLFQSSGKVTLAWHRECEEYGMIAS